MVKQIKNCNQQIVEETTRDRRIAKSIVVACSCEIVRVEGEKETYKVQSETNIDKYYIVKFMNGTPVYYSCPDFLNRIKTNPFYICKHMRSIVLAENYGLVTTATTNNKQSSSQVPESKSYRDEEYDF